MYYYEKELDNEYLAYILGITIEQLYNLCEKYDCDTYELLRYLKGR